jgi:fucose 4-O-acetylase-like acetyltransferase
VEDSIKKQKTMNQKAKTRNITWDYARGIAIVMIVFHHIYPRFYIDPSFHPNSIVYLICYTCQLPIFMYVSGLFANISIDRYGIVDLLKNRAVRLLLPFISFMLIWTIITPSRFPSAFLENFKYGYWFVFVLFEMMALLAFSKSIAEKKGVNAIYIITLLYVILSILKLCIPESNIINGLLSLNLLWHYFPFFIIGYFSNKIDWIFQKRYAIIAAVIYAISIVILQQSKSHNIIPICNISSLILAITLFSKGIRPFEFLFAKIGIYSMQIYLLHFFASLFTNYISPLSNPIEEFCLDIILTALLIIVCILVAKIIMNYEILAMYLFGIKKTKNNKNIESTCK